jgi:hypothetical protein
MAGLVLCAVSGNSGLFVYQIIQDDLLSGIADIIHPLRPAHLVCGFERFGDSLALRHLFYQLRKHSFRLLVNVGKMVIQLAAQ